MSRNPAWNKYNETVREINSAYEGAVAPERAMLKERLKDIEAEYGPKIRTIQAERDVVEAQAQKAFKDVVKKADQNREDALRHAAQVRQSELAAIAEREEDEKVAAGSANQTTQTSILRKHDRSAARNRTVPS